MLLICPAAISADQAQYFYDDLGRLSAVVDGSKNVSVYSYDAVGNILSVTNSAQGAGNIGIFFLSPTSGAVGTPVTIKGFGFDPTPSANAVAFNGTAASVSTSTTDTIQTVVPSGATTGTITVTNTNGTGTSPQTFTILVPPTVTSATPNKVFQGSTTNVVISGTSLLTATSVQFAQSGITATIIPGITQTSLPVSLAVAGTVPLGAYTFSVTTPAGVVSSGAVTVTVGVPAPSFAMSKIASVSMPITLTVPSTSAPSGWTTSVARADSVAIDQAPTGNVLLLHLDEAAGATSFADSSGGGYAFTCSGGACPTAGVSGKINTATQYDGITSYLTNTSTGLQTVTDGSFTFETWANPQDVPPTDCTTNNNTCAYAVFMRSNVYYVGFYYLYDSKYYVVFYNNSNQAFAIGSAVIAPGAWHHLALVIDNTNKLFRFYVDGQELAGSPISYTGVPKVFGTAPYYVGSYQPTLPNWKWFFKGSIDEAKIYNRALSAVEVWHNYNVH
jgi:YD repeat-containing protein